MRSSGDRNHEPTCREESRLSSSHEIPVDTSHGKGYAQPPGRTAALAFITKARADLLLH